MAETTVTTPYSSAMAYVTAALAGWTDEYNAQRLASYDLYDDMYHVEPSTYKLMLRGTDEKPIYIPTAKKLINTLARYVGKGWGYMVLAPDDPEADVNEEQIALAQRTMANFFRRERVLSKFTSGKKEWLRRGDWVWYISADSAKRAGRRISIRCIDPRVYFPIFDEDDVTRLSGAEIVEETIVGEDKIAIKVQRWLKPNHPLHPDYGFEESDEDPSSIYYDVTIYDVENFSNIDKRKTLSTPTPLTELEGITSLPLYQVKNNEESENPFGSSDLRGLESLVSGINQSASDEDLSLAMSGLGMYVTTAGAPEGGSWVLGPNRVVEIGEGDEFERLEGIDSVEPFQAHLEYLEGQMMSVSGISDVAQGTAQIKTGVSGLALAIRMQPMLDSAAEKDDSINTVMTQMLHDLKEWFLQFEEIDLGDVEILSVMSEANKLPFDRETRWKELMEGLTQGIFSAEFVLEELQDKFGYDTFPSNMLSQAQAAAAVKAAQADPFAARAADEVNAEDEDEEEVDSEADA
jgi:hypothetical protein